MALPAGITTCTVTIGTGGSFLGEDAIISGSVIADRDVVWSATGSALYNVESAITPSMAGGQASFAAPHVDQPGFIDASGNGVTDWYYVFNGRATFDGNRVKNITKRFQVKVGQTLVDLDLIPDGPVTPGVTVPAQYVTSVNGQTGAVELEGGGGAGDSDVAGYIADPDSETAGALAPLIASSSTGIPISVAEGKQVIVDCHSYGAGAGAQDSYGFVQRFDRHLGVAQINNFSISGATSSRLASPRVFGFHKFGLSSMFIFMAMANDMMDSDGHPRSLAKTKHSIAAYALACRASAVLKADDGRFTHAGFVADVGGNSLLGGQARTASAQGSTSTITGFAAGERVCVLLAGYDNERAPEGGGTYSISTQSSTTASAVVGSGTTGDQFRGARDWVQDGAYKGLLPVWFNMPTSGTAQTVTVTKTDGATTRLTVCGVLTGIDAPGTGVLEVFIKEPPAPYATDAKRNEWNSMMEATLNAIGGVGQDTLIIDPLDGGWVKERDVRADDGIHPNDRGHRAILDAVKKGVATVAFAPGRSTI